MVKKSNSIPGGGAKWPASKIGPDGKFARADLHMKNKPNSIPGGSPEPSERFRAGKKTTWNPNHKKANSIAGGSAWPAMEQKGGTTQRGVAFGPEGNISDQTGVSIFDPVLCELAYRWFCPAGGIILDPFAGGSVRGIVASILGRDYLGIDLREEQIQANIEQAKKICKGTLPKWIVGDSRDVMTLAAGQYDFIFSCPPYADLEVYSDNPKDLSTLEYSQFLKDYKSIIQNCCVFLKENRFACFVVGEVRGKTKEGFYYNFVGDTIKAFEEAGLKYYNEMILVTAVGSLPIRAGRVFNASRKIGKTHQNVLVFCKGDPIKAAKDCGQIEVEFPSDEFAQVSSSNISL